MATLAMTVTPPSPNFEKEETAAAASAGVASLTLTPPSPDKSNPGVKLMKRQRGLAKVQERLDEAFRDSQLTDRTNEYPKFSLKSVVCGNELGEGAFASVAEVRAFLVKGVSPQPKPTKPMGIQRAFSRRGSFAAAKSDNDEESNRSLNLSSRSLGLSGDEGEEGLIVETEQPRISKTELAENSLRPDGEARYVIKSLKPAILENSKLLHEGVTDMASEARILSDLTHPTICQLRAVSRSSPCSPDFFIILDRLHETLDSRIHYWSKYTKKTGSTSIFSRSHKRILKKHVEKLVVASQLAQAFAYLHSRRIVYRDIKPDNIAFDVNRKVRLFDFGLAKEMTKRRANSDGTFNLTQMCGSPRYMAGEVALGLPYNHTADVYSFTILLWQILSCQQPYKVFTVEDMPNKVWCKNGVRPDVSCIESENLQGMVERGWNHKPTKRGCMKRFAKDLEKEREAAKEQFALEQSGNNSMNNSVSSLDGSSKHSRRSFF